MEKKMYMIAVYGQQNKTGCIARAVVLAESAENAWDVFCDYMKKINIDYKHGNYYYNAFSVGNVCLVPQDA